VRATALAYLIRLQVTQHFGFRRLKNPRAYLPDRRTIETNDPKDFCSKLQFSSRFMLHVHGHYCFGTLSKS
jgi:hypothetical protein